MGNKLHKAVWDMKHDEVEKMLAASTTRRKDASAISTVEKDLAVISNTTPLTIALTRGDSKMIKLLLRYEADPNVIPPSNGISNLYEAVANLADKDSRKGRWDDLIIITEFIKHGANVNWTLKTAYGNTTVLEAAVEGHVGDDIHIDNRITLEHVIKLLIAKGASAKTSYEKFNKIATTPAGFSKRYLEVAARAAKYLKDTLYSAPPPAPVAAPRASVAPVAAPRASVAPVAAPRASVAPPRVPVPAPRGPMSVAAVINNNSNDNSNGRSKSKHRVNVFATRPGAAPVKRGVTIVENARAGAGTNPARTAGPSTQKGPMTARYNNTARVSNAAVNKEDVLGTGSWRLYETVRKGDYAAVVGLLAAGANPNKVHSKTGETPLYMAARASKDATDVTRGMEAVHTKIVKKLLDYGADKNHGMGSRSISILELANKGGYFSPAVNDLISESRVKFRGGQNTRRNRNYRAKTRRVRHSKRA